MFGDTGLFSAALCRGLIEATVPSRTPKRPPACFPRLYAAASLKRQLHGTVLRQPAGGFPRLYAAASLKPGSSVPVALVAARFPRLYAAASLKPGARLAEYEANVMFSAALCRGLIEATNG